MRRPGGDAVAVPVKGCDVCADATHATHTSPASPVDGRRPPRADERDE